MKRQRRSKGFSLIELLIVISIILIIGTIALPKLNRTLMYSKEVSAIQHIRTLHAAQAQYLSQFGRHAASLNELGPPASGTPGPTGADLIPGDLALGEKGGYKYTVQADPAGGYTINADPTVFNSTGTRTFFSDHTLVVRENYGVEPATVVSKELK
ncbi:MAG: prepilin-type N-terminal cleavage/methylation domain-containing protein [Bryobacteraceae bacterium]